MSDNLTVEQLIKQQFEVQERLLEATEKRTIAEEAAKAKAQEVIDKYNESIASSSLAKESHERMIKMVELLINKVEDIILMTKPVEMVIDKIDILIQIIQILISIVSQLHGASKESLERLQEQVFKLAQLSASRSNDLNIQQSSSSVGKVSSQQANIAQSIDAIQKEIEKDIKQ